MVEKLAAVHTDILVKLLWEAKCELVFIDIK